MSKLIEEACKRYPIGTIFINPVNGLSNKLTVNDSNFHMGNNNNLCVSVLEINGDAGKVGCVNYQGKWATIISSPSSSIYKKENEIDYQIFN